MSPLKYDYSCTNNYAFSLAELENTVFCFRSTQNYLKILSAPKNGIHPPPTWGQIKHCIQPKKKKIEYYFKHVFLANNTTFITLQKYMQQKQSSFI